MSTNLDIKVLIYGKKTDSRSEPEVLLGYSSQVNKKDFWCYKIITLKFISGIPDEEIAKLQNTFPSENLKKPRVFAEIDLQKFGVDNLFNAYLSPQRHPMSADFLPFFSHYMNPDKTSFKKEYQHNGYLTFAIDLQDFRRIYKPQGIENNASIGTYAMNKSSFKENAFEMENGVKFLPTKLLDDDWRNEKIKSKFKNSSSREGEPLIGKKSYFLHPKAGRFLYELTEKFLRDIGFDIIFLQADTLSLAYKVYGPLGYYPLYQKGVDGVVDQVNNEGWIKITGSKMGNESEVLSRIHSENNKKRLLTCDYTFGPQMFKFINEEHVDPSLRKKLKYQWFDERIECEGKKGRKVLNIKENKNTTLYGTFLDNKRTKKEVIYNKKREIYGNPANDNNWPSALVKKPEPKYHGYKPIGTIKKSRVLPKQGTYFQQHRRTYKRGQKK